MTDKAYNKKMQELRKAHNDVQKNGIKAAPEHVKEILELGLWEARDRVNTNEHLRQVLEGREANYLVRE